MSLDLGSSSSEVVSSFHDATGTFFRFSLRLAKRACVGGSDGPTRCSGDYSFDVTVESEEGVCADTTPVGDGRIRLVIFA